MGWEPDDAFGSGANGLAVAVSFLASDFQLCKSYAQVISLTASNSYLVFQNQTTLICPSHLFVPACTVFNLWQVEIELPFGQILAPLWSGQLWWEKNAGPWHLLLRKPREERATRLR